jgi:Zn-finger nucleic acid-binding protein
MPALFERLINKSDPDFERFDIVQCPDVGLDKGEWGKILMKVYVEQPMDI